MIVISTKSSVYHLDRSQSLSVPFWMYILFFRSIRYTSKLQHHHFGSVNEIFEKKKEENDKRIDREEWERTKEWNRKREKRISKSPQALLTNEQSTKLFQRNLKSKCIQYEEIMQLKDAVGWCFRILLYCLILYFYFSEHFWGFSIPNWPKIVKYSIPRFQRAFYIVVQIIYIVFHFGLFSQVNLSVNAAKISVFSISVSFFMLNFSLWKWRLYISILLPYVWWAILLLPM